MYDVMEGYLLERYKDIFEVFEYEMKNHILKKKDPKEITKFYQGAKHEIDILFEFYCDNNDNSYYDREINEWYERELL